MTSHPSLLPFTVLRRRLIAATIGLLCSVSGSLAWAQVVANPTALEFTASPDHSAVDFTGSPLLSHYDVQFYMTAAAQPFQTASIGKPQPGGGGIIRYGLSQLGALPSPGIVYQARIAAIGPGGSTASSLSNQFTFDNGNPCAYPLSPATQQVGSGGGNVQVTVDAASGCAWNASSSAGWLRITGGAGTGFGQVTATADPNPASSSRRATIAVGGQSAEVIQDAASGGGGGGGGCTVAIQPSAPTIDPSGGIGSLSITSGGSCQWSATSSVPWIAITAQTGAGSGWVSYSIPPNPSGSQRTGTVSVNGQSVVFTQLATGGGGGGGGGGCSVSVSPGAVSAGAAGSSDSLTVTAPNSCTWSTSTNASWITITAASGAGSGWVSYNIASNSGAARSGQIVVGNQSVTVNQAGSGSGGGGGGGGGGSCQATVTPSAVNVGASAATDSLSVSAASGCSWSAVSNAPWIVITAVTGSGSGWVSYNVLANGTGSSRTGTVTAAGQTITFTQAGTGGGGGGGGGGGCSPSVTPQQMSVGSSFSTASFTVNAPGTCSWTGTSLVPWITVTAVSGSGHGWVSFNVANNAGGQRTGQLTVAGQTVSVVQASSGGNAPLSMCPVSVSGPDIILAPGGAGAMLGVTSAGDCAWTARSGAAWLTIADGASGSGSNSITLQPVGDTTIERSTTVIIGDQTVTVTQTPREDLR